MKAKKIISVILTGIVAASMLAGCGNQKNETETTTEKGKKTLVIGDTTFNSSNEAVALISEEITLNRYSSIGRTLMAVT